MDMLKMHGSNYFGHIYPIRIPPSTQLTLEGNSQIVAQK